jgi:methionyl-tRNA formyltransferase
MTADAGRERAGRRAVVFAYHDVGVRCLLVLLARGVDVALVVTHRDRADENVWFGSVQATAAEHGLPVAYADDLDAAALEAAVADVAPDFLFSFYFRNMLPAAVLSIAGRGAYNMHGSLLPKYRGRVPINWAVIHGETETGATLHEMTVKPDAGAIIGQTTVPILPDDTAHEVFGKVVVAAEQTLWRALPDLLDGHPMRMPNELERGSYFGGRKPTDGRIDWNAAAVAIHNLVRAVAPPYPGAFTTIDGVHAIVERTRVAMRDGASDPAPPGTLRVVDGRAVAVAGDGGTLDILAATIDGRRYDGPALAARLGSGAHALGGST